MLFVVADVVVVVYKFIAREYGILFIQSPSQQAIFFCLSFFLFFFFVFVFCLFVFFFVFFFVFSLLLLN